MLTHAADSESPGAGAVLAPAGFPALAGGVAGAVAAVVGAGAGIVGKAEVVIVHITKTKSFNGSHLPDEREEVH